MNRVLLFWLAFYVIGFITTWVVDLYMEQPCLKTRLIICFTWPLFLCFFLYCTIQRWRRMR